MKKANFFPLVITILNSINIYCQNALKSIPNLQKIIAYEVTGAINKHSYEISDVRLYERLENSLENRNDFGGVPGAENYDIYFSDSSGKLDQNGEYLTIECRYLGNSGGGGCNIAQIELEFSNGFKISPTKLASFYKDGSNYLPESELKAVDCNPNTWSTLGNNDKTSNTTFLRLTFDLKDIISISNFTKCQGSNFEYKVNSTIFNESNPSGTVFVNTSNGCNKIEIVKIIYEQLIYKDIKYIGCVGDKYQINIAGITFNENNPNGVLTTSSSTTCDTIFNVNLKFEPNPFKSISIITCDKDFLFSIGGNTFSLENPIGTVNIPSIISCDTTYNIQISYEPNISKSINYYGCTGDQFSIKINGNVFDESNPKGEVIISGNTECDTIYYIELVYRDITLVNIEENKCIHDNYTLNIGDELFSKENPKGKVLISPINSCDTLFDVNLIFHDCISECQLYAPNVLSYNSNYNNIFEIKYRDFCELSKTNLSIYDRWGNLIYYNTKPIWDGTFNGKVVESGIYVYIFEYTTFNQAKYLSGNITVLK